MKIYIIEKPQKAEHLQEYLAKYGEVILLHKETKSISDYDELLSDAEEKILAIAPGEIAWSVPNDYITKIPKLKGIVTKSSWGNYIDLAYCKKQGIAVGNSPGANAQSVAEYAVWQMLSLLRKLPLQLGAKFKVETNDASEGENASGKTVGILGMGRIGRIIAKITEAMGMKITYWSRNKKDVPYEFVQLDALLQKSDVLFKCWETCEETKPLLNAQNLQLLQKNAYFISVFGGIGFSGEDDYILLDYAEQGRIAGFSIENEHAKDAKIKDSYKGNVFIPSALAWHTKQTHEIYNRVMADTIIGMVKGREVNRL